MPLSPINKKRNFEIESMCVDEPSLKKERRMDDVNILNVAFEASLSKRVLQVANTIEEIEPLFKSENKDFVWDKITEKYQEIIETNSFDSQCILVLCNLIVMSYRIGCKDKNVTKSMQDTLNANMHLMDIVQLDEYRFSTTFFLTPQENFAIAPIIHDLRYKEAVYINLARKALKISNFDLALQVYGIVPSHLQERLSIFLSEHLQYKQTKKANLLDMKASSKKVIERHQEQLRANIHVPIDKSIIQAYRNSDKVALELPSLEIYLENAFNSFKNAMKHYQGKTDKESLYTWNLLSGIPQPPLLYNGFSN